MVKFYFSKTMLAFLLMFVTGSICSAKDIYVSATGNDGNDGITAATAYATFEKALEEVSDYDRILVSGTIVVSDEVIVENKKGLIIEGVDKRTSAVDGAEASRLFLLENSEVILWKLTLKNGFADDEGGGIKINGGTVTFAECTFNNNKNSLGEWQKGGAIFAANTALTIYDCVFDSNKGFRGGALEILSSSLNCEYTTFRRNEAAFALGTDNQEARAGAFSAENPSSISFRYCTFDSNKAAAGGGAMFIGTSIEGTFYMENCAIVKNSAGNDGFDGRHGGALFVANGGGALTTTIINTTIAQNSCNGAGGILFYDGGSQSTLNLINVTATKNYTTSNAGNGGGFRLFDSPLKFNVYNSIIEGNQSKDDESWNDLSIGANPNVVFKNSVVGNANINEVYDIDETSMINNSDPESPEIPNYSGITEDAPVKNTYQLQEGANGITMGNAQFLQERNILKDQKDVDRDFSSGTCYLGAIELIVGEDVPNVVVPPFVPVGIISDFIDSITGVYYNSSSKCVVVNELSPGNYTCDLYSMTGRKVTTVFKGEASVVSGQSFDVSNVSAGVYLLKVSGGGKFIAKPVIIR